MGRLSYLTPAGMAEGELLLKRQFTINNGKLERFLDMDITTTDAFLQAVLEENKDNRLRDIVSTIQAEQDAIIRADINNPLIVQGAAGSGKTTIALHRIAYLIYTYRKTFRPDNFLVIAPNRLFLNYISEVLPELGVDHVRQTTFIELSYHLLGITYKLAKPYEKLIRLIKQELPEDRQLSLLPKASQFKGSLELKDIIDRYISFLEQSIIPKQDFRLDEYILYTAEEIRKMVLYDFSISPLYSRITKLKVALTKKLKRDGNAIIEEVANSFDKQIDYLRDTMKPSEERRIKIVALIDERDQKVNTLKKAAKTAVAKYLALFPKHGILYYYKELITSPDKIKRFGGDAENNGMITYLCEYTAKLIKKKTIELEDLTPMLYIKYKLFGLEKMDIKYVIIDEAQDFSVFQIYTLTKILNTELFTIMGDLAQGIHSYRGVRDWRDVREKVFINNNCKFLTLEQSYRTTIEIMNMANEVLKMERLPGLVLARPVVRHGEKPGIYRFSTAEDLIDKLEQRIQSFKNKHYSTIAVICKTIDECTKVKELLDKRGKIIAKQLNEEDSSYEGGTVIIPSYLSKGLEFDAVVIVSLTEDYIEDELDCKLLYVAMTRALHCLDFMCYGKSLALLNKINESLYSMPNVLHFSS